MKRFKTVGTLSILLLCTGLSIPAFALAPPNALNSIPADCPFVFGINVQQLIASSFFAKLKQEQPQAEQIGSEFAKLAEKIGFNPARDISYIVIAANSIDKAKPQAVLIVSGVFDQGRITSYLRSDMSSIEMAYGGASILTIPEKKANGTKAGITFLGNEEVAIGDLDSLKAVLDTRSGTKKNILSNADMVSLFSSIQFGDMFWFAANTANALKQSQIATPLGLNQNSIKSIFGSLNFGDNAVGKITATANDEDSATKLANVFKGMIAFGQLSGNRNPDAKLMLDRVAITQNATQVRLAFEIPNELIKKAGRAKIQQMGTTGSPTPRPIK
jgi:hypothetical protein